MLGRFCRWAEARGLTLESISASEVKAYFAETPEERYLAPVGDLLRRLAAAGVVTGKPVRRKAMRKKATAVPRSSAPPASGPLPPIGKSSTIRNGARGHAQTLRPACQAVLPLGRGPGPDAGDDRWRDAAAYAAEIAAQAPPQAANLALTAVRRPFRHLAGSGVISANPFETPRLGSREVSGDVTGSLEARSGRSKSCGGMASAPTSWARKSPGPRPRS